MLKSSFVIENCGSRVLDSVWDVLVASWHKSAR